MMPFPRDPIPEVLRRNYKSWGKRFASRRSTNPKAVFSWPTHNKQNMGQMIRSQLIRTGFNHCAYCDGFPLGETSLQTLDHFRPKSRHPLLALVWHNLFLCCDICQNAKAEKFDRRLLKPDRLDYCFESFYYVDFRTGKLRPNPRAPADDQGRADYTIQLLNLNRPERCKSRLAHLRLDTTDYEINDLPYRYLFSQ